jgi:hypothetical protein
MDEGGQEDDYSSLDSNESLAVDQSSSLQVETLGHWEQIESGDRSKETADTQQVNSSVEEEDGECYLQAPSATRQGVKRQVQRAPRGEFARMWSCQRRGGQVESEEH